MIPTNLSSWVTGNRLTCFNAIVAAALCTLVPAAILINGVEHVGPTSVNKALLLARKDVSKSRSVKIPNGSP